MTGAAITVAYFVAVTLLVAFAIVRRHEKMERHDWCAWAMAGGLVASITLSASGAWSIMPGAAAIDAATCLAMLALWTRYTSMRAWTIGFIGLAKCGAHMAQYLVDPVQISWGYFYAINGAFVVQVLVAGGWIDAVGKWADRHFARLAPVRHRLLRDGR